LYNIKITHVTPRYATPGLELSPEIFQGTGWWLREDMFKGKQLAPFAFGGECDVQDRGDLFAIERLTVCTAYLCALSFITHHPKKMLS
jgi:hypothetical protein